MRKVVVVVVGLAFVRLQDVVQTLLSLSGGGLDALLLTPTPLGVELLLDHLPFLVPRRVV